MWKGLPLGEDGFLTIAAEYKDQAHTERSGYNMRQIYPKLANGSFDPRELTYNRFDAWYGEPEMKQTTLFANAGQSLGGGVKLYGWTSYQNRDARSAGFVRPAQDVRNIIVDLSGRLLADHRTDGGRLQRHRRRHLDHGRLGHGRLARLRQEQDGVHDREHLEPFDRRQQQDLVLRRRLLLRPGGVQPDRGAHGCRWMRWPRR